MTTAVSYHKRCEEDRRLDEEGVQMGVGMSVFMYKHGTIRTRQRQKHTLSTHLHVLHGNSNLRM